MAKTKLSPFVQGDLDGLCGFYCVVNAVRCAAAKTKRRPPAVSHFVAADADQWMRMVLHMARAFETRRQLAQALATGIGTLEMCLLLRAAAAYVAARHAVRLDWRRPFAGAAKSSQRAVERALRTHLAREATSAIVGIGPPINHWTVVHGATAKRLLLLDSSGDRWMPVWRQRAEEQVRLLPSSVFALWLCTVAAEAPRSAKGRRP